MWRLPDLKKSVENPQPVSLQLTIEQMIAMARGESRRLSRSRINSFQSGDWRDRRRGRGLELESIGPYQAGDDVRHIDWCSSARIGQPQVKRFYMEIQWTLIIIIDLRSSMYFGTKEQLMATTACLAAAHIAFAFAPGHQSVGFVIIDDESETVLAAHRGRVARLRHLNSIVDAHNERIDSAFRSVSPLAPALTRLSDQLPRNAELVLVSDLSYPGDDIVSAITRFGRRSMRVVVVEDSLQQQRPPRGRYPLKMAGDTAPQWVTLGHAGTKAASVWSDSTQRQRSQLSEMLASAGVTNVTRTDAISISSGII